MGSTTAIAINTAWAALHTLQYGFGISSFNGIQDVVTCPHTQSGVRDHNWLSSCVPLTTTQFGLIVAIFTLGGLVGALSTDAMAKRLGRVGTLRVSAFTVLVGSAITGLASTYALLLVGRIIIGFGCGLATVLVPLYLSEIAPSSMKKSLGIANQFFIVVGILIGQSLSLPLGEPTKWRWVFLVAVGIAVLQLIGSFFLPGTTASAEFEQGTNGEDRPLLPQAQDDGSEEGTMSIKELIFSKDSVVRRGFLLVIVTQLVQQLCGISPVMYFSTRILTPVFQGNSKFIALGIVLLKLPITVVPAFIIERLGSKPILLFSATAMSVSSLLLAIGLNAPSQPLSVIAILTFVAAFSLGLGPVTWVVLPEVMPKRAVTAAGSVGLALNWTLNFGMGASFLPLQHWLAGLTRNGEGNIFYVFSAFCIFGAVGILSCYRLKERVG